MSALPISVLARVFNTDVRRIRALIVREAIPTKPDPLDRRKKLVDLDAFEAALIREADRDAKAA